MLNGAQFERVCTAFIDVFDLADLRMLVRSSLHQRLDVIVATDNPLSQVVFDLVEWAERNHMLLLLVAAAAHERPASQALAQLAGELAKRQAPAQMQRIDLNQQLREVAEPQADIDTTLITWLINRAQQTYTLARLVQRAQSLRSPRPLVCLLHGQDNECHDKFVERIVRYQLRSLIPAPAGVPQHLLLELPPRKYGSPAELHDFLRAGLGGNALGSMAATVEEVNSRFANFRAPVVIHTWMNVAGWGAGERAVVRDYLDFWNQWPELAASQWLFIFLCIRVQPKAQGWLASLLGRKGDGGGLDQALAEFGTPDAAGQVAGANNIICMPLPALEPIPREDAEGWASDPKIQRRFLGLDLVTEVGRIYSAQRQPAIPMATLHRMLVETLNLSFDSAQ